MKTFLALARVLLAWVALSAAQAIAGMLVPMKSAAASNSYGWLLSNLLIAAAVGFVAACSDWRGWRLGVALAGIPCGITVIDAIEGWVFLTATDINWGRLIIFMVVSYALVAPLWVLIFRWRTGALALHEVTPGARSLGANLWRLGVSDVIYFSLYLTAGMIIFPYVRAFYATQTLPPFGKLAMLQLLLRGPLFVGICVLLSRMIGLSRMAGALATGAVFVVLSGIAPLIVPNPVFPDSVRLAHLCEVTGSNFLFGAFVGWLWSAPPRIAVVADRAA